MKLTMEKIPLADLILFVVDSSKPFDNEDTLIVEAILGRRVLVVSNKTDLPPSIQFPEQINFGPVVRISARDGAGIEELREAIFATIHPWGVSGWPRFYRPLSGTSP